MSEVNENIETTEEVTDLQTPDPTATVTKLDVFETTTDGKITVLNVIGGCIVNTYFKDSVSSVFVPGNHIRDGKIGQM